MPDPTVDWRKAVPTKLIALFALLLAGCVHAAEGPVRNEYRVTYKVQSTFQEVKSLVSESIKGQGLVINNISHIGNMLSRTGKDLGFSKQVYIEAEALEFCSATVSRAMMEADAHNIIYCPYIIAIYVIPAEPKTVYVSYRRPDVIGDEKGKKSLQAVETLLDKIITGALEWVN